MNRPLLCVTVTGETTADLRRRRDEVRDADLVELRLDSVRDPDAAGALAGRRTPVIVTCRPVWEGGRFQGSEEERKRILADAIALGADYVDFEWRAQWDDLIGQTGGRGIVLSMHDFTTVPSDLDATMTAMRATGAQVVKVAATVGHLAECVPLLELGARHRPDGEIVVLGMGDRGLSTRLLAGRFGSAWTYAGTIRDIGQISAASMVNVFGFREIGDATALYGIVGGSIAHSVSPSMHNAAFRALGLDAVYLPLPATSAADYVTFARAIGMSGASVTIPHKVALLDAVDDVDPVARRIGAINTIRVEDGRWVGRNTDAGGFLQPLRERVAIDGLRAAVVGAGGAARAVVVALASSGCRVRVHARQRAKAEPVAMLASAEVGEWPPEPGSWDLLINCTPIGMYPRVDDTPVPREHLTGPYVYDLVYNPTATRLLRDAASMGCQTIGGLEMLVAQAQEQFRWWTGRQAPGGVMRDAALMRLSEFARDENHVV
jgi:3-dehydroquinate dehydratase/shikimate dehydrogenase